jgi:hypothetical protein
VLWFSILLLRNIESRIDFGYGNLMLPCSLKWSLVLRPYMVKINWMNPRLENWLCVLDVLTLQDRLVSINCVWCYVIWKILNTLKLYLNLVVWWDEWNRLCITEVCQYCVSLVPLIFQKKNISYFFSITYMAYQRGC